ncbi:MAG TPA: acetolactate decarboxylase [Flavipsychrobacter sp.]
MAATAQYEVHVSGAMSNVMKKGQLYGTISLDTIQQPHLFGLGPVEYLAGEITIADGRAYTSKVLSPTAMEVKETYDLKAPFFVYSRVDDWKEYTLPDSVTGIETLERHLDGISRNSQRPFAFRLEGVVPSARIHIVNLPPGTKVSKPADAQKGKTYYPVKNMHADIIGFFSTEHQTVFTHHDRYIHMHLVSKDRKTMGHIDELLLNKELKLYLPF